MISLLDHLNKLPTFLIIADTGSLQGAAKHLRISQPALSLKLKNLELAVGFQLFIRSKKGVELTQAGHNLYRFSKRLVSDAEFLSLELIGEHSRLRVGTFDIIAGMIARELCKSESLMDITFRTERAVLVLLDALIKEEIDIAIVDDPPEIPGLRYKKLARSPYGLFATKAFAKTLLHTKATELQALQNAPLVYLPGGIAYEVSGAGKLAFKRLIDSFIEQLGFGGGKRIRVDSYALGLEVTLQGQGIGLLLAGHILDQLRSGALIELKHDDLPMPFSSMLSMVTKADRNASQLAEALGDIEGVFRNAVSTYRAVKSKRRRSRFASPLAGV